MSKLGTSFTVNDTNGEITSRSVKDKALHADSTDGTGITVNASGKLALVAAGSSLALGVQRDEVSKFAGVVLQGSLADTRTGGGVFSVENTYGTTLMVKRVLLHITTGSTGASTVDIGIGATAVTSADKLLDGVTLTATGAAFAADNVADKGTNGKPYGVWSSGTFVTASEATGDVTGLVGTYLIEAVDMN